MKQNSKGYYCSTPMTKSPDGKTVLTWCTWKPAPDGGNGRPERQQLEANVLTIIDKKLNQILEGQKIIVDMLSSIGGRETPEPSVNTKPLPF